MNLRLGVICFLLVMNISSSAQLNPSTMFEGLFTSIRNRDSLNFVKYLLSSDELLEIAKAARKDSINIDSINMNSPLYKTQGNNEFYQHYLIGQDFQPLISKADSLKINFQDMVYLNSKYQIIKDPQVFFTSLNGTIFFSDKKSSYQLKIEEAIFSNDAWKILQLGDLTVINDSSVLNSKLVKTSAFNSLIFERTIVSDTTLEHIKEPKSYMHKMKNKSD
jgi:hypothetical protein